MNRPRPAHPAPSSAPSVLNAATAFAAVAALPGGGAAAEDPAITVAQAEQTSPDLRNEVPVLVRGADARGVAVAADRLVALGHARAWAVTP